MAMITCPECGREVSDKAVSCPNCGAPINSPQGNAPEASEKKFCKYCGEQIDKECIICPKCGKQVESLGTNTPNIIVNNSSSASANAIVRPVIYGKPKNKWVALCLCIFLGLLGAHKFYEGKVGMGILYILTMGLFGIGVFIDFILLLFKPNPYYV